VVFVDTGYHFAETIGTRDAADATLAIHVVNASPAMPVSEFEATHGKLYETNPDLCCALRKVIPLNEALAPYEAWASGIRRSETRTRVMSPVVGWDSARGKVRVSPLARWNDQQIDSYIARHSILVNPLLSDGYGSVGCWPCTRRTPQGADSRAGRWLGFTKTECGINE
jgi:phosphoadenosine phosphosulfate reductase